MVETAWTDAPSGQRAWGRTKGFERLVKKKKKSETETHRDWRNTDSCKTQRKREISNRERQTHTDTQTIRSAQEHKEKHQEENVVLWGEGGGLRKEKKHRKLSRQPERELERHR